MLLQSADNVRDFAELDQHTGKLEYFSKQGAEVERLQAEIDGRYAFVEQTLVALYREDDLFKLRLAEEVYDIDDDVESNLKRTLRYHLVRQVPNHSLQVSLSRLLLAHSTFELIRKGTVILTFKYRLPLPVSPIFDPTPFVQEEDSDFMLFVHNVISDPQRRNTIWYKASV
jgi:hypothetical protein